MTAIPGAPPVAPGVHTMPEADYFAATWALSSSGAKAILDCPARFRWEQDHRVYKATFDFGSAAHLMVLGAGPPVQVIDVAYLKQLAGEAPDPKTAEMYAKAASGDEITEWRTNAAKAAKEAARATGKIPLLRRAYEHVCAMADVLRADPVASHLFDPAAGLPEQSIFWKDQETGVQRRARLDWLPEPRGSRLVVADYKTTTDASPDSIYKAVGNFAYHIQRAWYTDAIVAAGLDDDPAFVFCFQETDPPYLINIIQLDPAAIQSGRIACRAAIERFRDCSAAGVWPGYMPDELEELAEISVPPWKTRIPDGYYYEGSTL